MLKYFSRTIIFLAEINNLIEDKFFYEKFGVKISNLLDSYIIFSSRSGDNVAQYQMANTKVIESLDNILEMFEELKYLNLIRYSPLFLQAQKNLLEFKLELKEYGNKLPKFKSESVETKELEKQTDQKSTIGNIIKKNPKLNQSKKRILEFIRNSPNTRTKDIISEFNALSDRTVKRNLTDLLRTGLIKKRIDSKAVYYYASE